jgi:type II secretion system protein H
MIHRRRQSGFTLIELILVLVIMCTVMALAAPTLRGWSKGSRLRNSADEFIAATRWARSKAASDGSNYAIAIDKQSNTYKVQVQTGQTYTDADGMFAAAVTLPEGSKIESTDDTITFYPTGRVDPATVRITGPDGDSITVQCASPAEDFAIANADQNR